MPRSFSVIRLTNERGARSAAFSGGTSQIPTPSRPGGFTANPDHVDHAAASVVTTVVVGRDPKIHRRIRSGKNRNAMPIDNDLVLDPTDPRLYARYVELCRQASIDPPPAPEWVREQLSRWNAMFRDDTLERLI